MAVDQTTSADAGVETTDAPPKPEPPPPQPDRPGAEGYPSRAESRAAAMRPTETATQSSDRPTEIETNSTDKPQTSTAPDTQDAPERGDRADNQTDTSTAPKRDGSRPQDERETEQPGSPESRPADTASPSSTDRTSASTTDQPGVEGFPSRAESRTFAATAIEEPDHGRESPALSRTADQDQDTAAEADDGQQQASAPEQSPRDSAATELPDTRHENRPAENTETLPSHDHTWSPPPDQPGAEGFPSREESRAAASRPEAVPPADESKPDDVSDAQPPPDTPALTPEANKDQDITEVEQPAHQEQGEEPAHPPDDPAQDVGEDNHDPYDQPHAPSPQVPLEDEPDDGSAEGEEARTLAIEFPVGDRLLLRGYLPEEHESPGSQDVEPYEPGEIEQGRGPERTDGNDRLSDLPSGQDLLETEDDEKSRAERASRQLLEGVEDARDAATNIESTAKGFLSKPPPDSLASTSVNVEKISPAPQQGINTAEAFTGVLAVGLALGEGYRWLRGKIQRSREG